MYVALDTEDTSQSTHSVVVIKEGCILQIISFLFAAILTNIEMPCGVAQPARQILA